MSLHQTVSRFSYYSITSSYERWNLGVFCMQWEGFPWFCKKHWELFSWREGKYLSFFYPESPDSGFHLCIFCCSYYIFIYSGVEITTLDYSFSGKKPQPRTPLNKQNYLQASDLPSEIPRLGAFKNSAYRSTTLFHIAKGIWGLFLSHKEAGK